MSMGNWVYVTASAGPSQRWRADETVLFSSYIIFSVWRAGSSDQNFNENFFFFCRLCSSFLRTPHTHTHTLKQVHTCTHHAVWILSKPLCFLQRISCQIRLTELHFHCMRWRRQDSDLISGSLQAADIRVLFTLELHSCGVLEFVSGHFQTSRCCHFSR